MVVSTHASAEPSDPSSRIAFVLLARAEAPSTKTIIERYHALEPTEPLTLAGSVAKNGIDAVELRVADAGGLFVTSMPIPVPHHEAENAAQFSVSRHGTGWKLPTHTAHLVVFFRAKPGANAEESLARFTSLVAAVSEAAHAVGIYCGSVPVTHDPHYFSVVAQKHKSALRLTLWTGVDIAQDGPSRTSLLSVGMKQFGLPDVQLTAPKAASQKALAMLFDLLSYQMSRGSAVPDGDTVGRTDAERLTVQYVPSPSNKHAKGWRVDLP